MALVSEYSLTTTNNLRTDIVSSTPYTVPSSSRTDNLMSSSSSHQSPPAAYLKVYGASLLLTSILGTFGNILVICSVLLNKKLRVLQNVFIVNLAVADLLVTTLMMPFSITGIFVDQLNMEEFFSRNSGLCEFLATVSVACCASSILSIASISVNRYVFICHRLIYPRIYRKVTVPLMLAAIWASALLLDLPNYTGWGDHLYDQRNYICNYDFSADYSYTYFLLSVGLGIPTCVMTFCYVKIYLLARQSSLRVQDHASAGVHQHNKRSVIRGDDRRLLKTILTVWMVFLLCWSPYGLIILSGLGDIQWLFLPSVALLFANSSLNFIIYGMNKSFRNGYKEVLGQVCPALCFGKWLTPTVDDPPASESNTNQ